MPIGRVIDAAIVAGMELHDSASAFVVPPSGGIVPFPKEGETTIRTRVIAAIFRSDWRILPICRIVQLQGVLW
jgi:hypothetical protein